MKRPLLVAALFAALLSPAAAADSTVPAMGNATSVAGTDGLYCIQSSGTTEKQCLASQVGAYIFGLMSGDATVNGTGGVTLGASGVTPGAYTNANVTVDSKGRITLIASGSGGTIIAGTTPTSGITSGNLLGSTSNLTVDTGVAFNNLVTLNGNNVHTGNNSFTGTAQFTGALAATTVNGQASVSGSASNGLVIQGKGSSNDLLINNSGGVEICNTVTGSTSLTCNRFQVLSNTAAGNGIYLPAANTPGFMANGANAGQFTAALALLPGGLQVTTLDTAGTVAGSLCATSAGLFEYKVGVNCFAGGGSAGGSANQIQWNSAGSLAGFTMSGDMTLVTSTGVASLKATGPGATGPIGSTTTTPVVTIDAQGRVTALTSATIALPAAANPTGTAGPTAVNGSATTWMRSDGAPAIQKASNAQFGIMEGDGVTVNCIAGVCTSVPAVGRRVVSGTTDTIASTDWGNLVYYSSASSIAVTLPSSFGTGFFFTACTTGAGTATFTATSIVGTTTYALPGGGSVIQPVCVTLQYDGSTYSAIPSFIVNAAMLTAGTLPAGRMPALTGDLTTSAGAVATTLATVNGNVGSFGSTTSCVNLTANAKGLITAISAATCAPALGSVTGFGTGVAAQLGIAVSTAGGSTQTIFHGTAVMGTALIASGACATVVTVTATNVTTTDIIRAGFNTDPTAITGFVPLATGVLTDYIWPTANTINIKECNFTAASITPGAHTFNVSVER